MERHFVTFYSPGTFVSEESMKPIDSWDVDKAVAMAKDIHERYAARPYGFRFSTRRREANDLDSHEAARSPMYFLGGVIRTLEEVERDNDPNEEILRRNMRSNGYKRIVTNCNSWKWTQPLEDEDVVLQVAL